MHSDDPSRYAVRDKTTTAAAVLRGPTSTAPTTFEPFAIRSLERQRSLDHDNNDSNDDDDHHHDHDDDFKNDSDHHLNGGGGGGGGGAVCVKTVAMPAVKVAVATTRTTPTTNNDQLRQHKLSRADCKKAAGSDEGVCREGTPAVGANDDGQEEGSTSQQRPVSATAGGRRPPLLASSSSSSRSSSSNTSSSTSTSHNSSGSNGISSSNISNNSGSSNSSSNKNGISGNSCSKNSGSSSSGSSNSNSSRTSNCRSNNSNNNSSSGNNSRPRVPAPAKKHIRRVIGPRQNTNNTSTTTMTNAESGSRTTLHLALQTTALLYDDNNNNAGAAAAPASVIKPRGLFNSHDAFEFLVNAPACSSGDTFGLFLDTNLPPSLKNAYTDQANSPKGCGSPRSWFDRYAEALERRPLLYKCLTSAVVGTVGDLMAQTAFWARGGDVVWHDKQAMRRTLAVAVDGFCFNAPFLHYMYDALDQWIPAEEKTSNAVKQIVIDIVVLDPVFAFAFIVTTGVLQGQSVEADIIPAIKADYLNLVLWLMLIGLVLAPPRVYLFHSFPLKWRVLIADGIDLLWTFVAVCSTGRG